MAEVLQVYAVPFADLPVAPAGEQNAPGLTGEAVACCVGVGEAETVGVGGVPTVTVMISDLVLFRTPLEDICIASV